MTSLCRECKWSKVDPNMYGNGWFDRLLRWWYKGPPPGVLENLLCSHPACSRDFGMPRCWQARDTRMIGCTSKGIYWERRTEPL